MLNKIILVSSVLILTQGRSPNFRDFPNIPNGRSTHIKRGNVDFQDFQTTTTIPPVNYAQVLQDPAFFEFLDSLRKNQAQQTTTTTTTTTTRRPVNFQNFQNNPFFQQEGFFQNTKTDSQNQQQTHLNQNPFLQQNKNTFIGLETAPTETPKIRSRFNAQPEPRERFSIAVPEPAKVAVAQPESKTDELTRQLEEELFKKQAKSAKYAFASAVDDSINQNQHQREEVRDGLAVKGKYSYSDGFYKRTVEYEADEKGYRVVGETVEEIGQGPQINPDGRAKVATYVAGNAVKYEITEDDVQKKKPQSLITEEF